MTACLDNVKGLGDYLELEILTDTEEKSTEALLAELDVLRAEREEKSGLKGECKL